ncbi:hypothetical protein ACVWXQ_009083 [Bradyrhizobium sp. S3.14.4]
MFDIAAAIAPPIAAPVADPPARLSAAEPEPLLSMVSFSA